jgi:hypothetical protein
MFRRILTVMLFSAPMANFTSSVQSDLKSTIKEQNEASPVICDYTCMTIISVRVPDKNGKKATDLTRAGFAIYENGVKQEIYDFMRVESPEKMGVRLSIN